MDNTLLKNETADLLARLVACPSVNPQGSAPPGPPYGEGALAHLLESLVAPWADEVRTVEVAPGRVNFMARLAGTGPRTLLLDAHADTVSADGMTVAPFEPVIRDGRLYGRGSCDAKAAMAAMLLAMQSVRESGRPPAATVWFTATADEELGCLGAARLTADARKVPGTSFSRPDGAIVGEPTGLAAVYAHKGAHRFRIITRGRAAHSSDPSRGTSAIAQMARVIEAIEGPLAERLRACPHPVLGPATVSVGTIRGGSQVNIVPHRCEIEVDWRVLPGQARPAMAAEVRALLDDLRRQDPRLDYEYEETQWYAPLEEDPHGPLAGVVRVALTAALGRADFTTVPWASNASVFHAAGIPCIVLGPGSTGQAHTADESVALDDVARAVPLYAEIIRRF
jgi:acetylornithine deacetylase